MESRTLPAPNPIETEFNVIQFEKRLAQLKDSQESINSLSAWCLENRQHHKKIVNAWLNVLKKVKVEHRLTLFYLANDVIQYSKRKNYDFVESWGTTLQKATTMVREDKVKNRILRIFKIWEQRGIYGEEFIADLSGLISASPTARRMEQDPHDFQPQYLMNKIKTCARLEMETDFKMQNFKDKNFKITDSESLCASLKDRRHVEDVEQEVEEGIVLMESYVSALKSEIKSRTHLISLLEQAETFYHTERGEVKVVANAYKSFGARVKNQKRKLDELIPTLNSPLPSPDINAPSPEPDSDIDLPQQETRKTAGVTLYSLSETYNAGYYNQTSAQEDFSNNSSFTSFIGTNFNMQPFNTSNMFAEQDTFNVPHVPQPEMGVLNSPTVKVYDYNHIIQAPLLPPPMPPFTSGYADHSSYSDPAYAQSSNSYGSSEIASYKSTSDAYNPEEELETWELGANWDVSSFLETPESPPSYEKEGFRDPIEYDESKTINHNKDVDLRVMRASPKRNMPDVNRQLNRSPKDIDHRNLISLIGSPRNDLTSQILQPPPAPPLLWNDNVDQDYCKNPSVLQDRDYRVPVDIAQQLKLPPPPPPPTRLTSKISHKKSVSVQDNVESIDMDLSDDDTGNVNQENTGMPVSNQKSKHTNDINNAQRQKIFGNKSVEVISNPNDVLLEPPPPIPPNLCEIPEDRSIENVEQKCKVVLFDSQLNLNGPIHSTDQMGNSHLGSISNETMMGPLPMQLTPICEIPTGMMTPSGGIPPPENMMGLPSGMGVPPGNISSGPSGGMSSCPPPPANMGPPGSICGNWSSEFYDRPPDFQNRPAPALLNFPKRSKNEFQTGFRGRSNFSDIGESFRSRGRGRGMWNRGMRNNRGYGGRGRGFRGKFRGF